MTCPRCRTDVREASVCGECGLRLLRSVAGIMKTSAVMIAERDHDSFYTSVHEVPAPLRMRLEEATSGSNSGTILIADKAGRERIRAQAEERLQPVEKNPEPEAGDAPPKWALWAGLVLLVVAIMIIVLVWGKWPNG